MKSQTLLVSEWIFLAFLAVSIGTIYSITKFTSYRCMEKIHSWELPEEIFIEVRGHVKRPGRYLSAPGESLRSVVKRAQPKPLANLRALDLDRIPDESLKLEIALLETIQIRVQGCVEKELELTLPVGSRICDLKELILVSPDAETKFLRRRRILKDGEIVVVPRLSKPKKISHLSRDVKGKTKGSSKESGDFN